MRLKTALILIFVLGCLALLTAMRIHSFDEPLERDDAYYAVMGKEILSGAWPYADLWSNTPPGIHLLYALAIKFLGYTEQCVKVMGLLFSLLTAVGIFLLAARCSTVYGGCLALLLFAVTSSDPRLQGNSFNCEVPMNTFLVWAYYFLAVHMTRSALWKAAAAGILLGLAALVKTVAIAPFIGGGILILLGWDGAGWKRRLAHASAYLLFAALPWVLCMAAFRLAGRFELLWDCVFRFNAVYYSGQKWSVMPLALMANSRAMALTWPLWLAAAVWIVRSAPWRSSAGCVLAAVWFLSTLLEIALPGKYWPHYYYLGLPPCLLAMAMLVGRLGQLRGISAVGLGLALLCASAYVGVKEYTDYLRLAPEEISTAKYGASLFVEARRFGKLLGERMPEEEKLFNWGTETELYFYSNRRPATRFLVNYPMTQGRQEWLVHELVRQLEREKPGVIVVSDNVPDALQHFLDGNYELSERHEFFISYTRLRSACKP
ncbi:MAG: glycosyltransferase family 39 protein [Planctomycetota bacterium]